MLDARRKKIEGVIDYFVARSEAECRSAEKLIEEARLNNDYHEEKAAAKILAFLQAEQNMLRLYAELELYHDDLAEVIKASRPYLAVLSKDAEDKWQAFQKNL